MKPNNTFPGYEQDDKLRFVRPPQYHHNLPGGGGTECILETGQKQWAVKDEESPCLIDFTKLLVKINRECQGEERTIRINTDKIPRLNDTIMTTQQNPPMTASS